MEKIFLYGRYKKNTGPQNVNRALINLKDLNLLDFQINILEEQKLFLNQGAVNVFLFQEFVLEEHWS